MAPPQNPDITPIIASEAPEKTHHKHDISHLPQNAIARLEARIAPLQKCLADHPLYSAVQNFEDLKIFMQSHVFAVWDFMSLLKYLQWELTNIEVPWVPRGFRESRRLINEIVLGEESDFVAGQNISHLELYLDSMKACGADYSALISVMEDLAITKNISEEAIALAFEKANGPKAAQKFVQKTFEFIRSGKLHVVASAFTFGREDLIPVMFSGLLRDMNRDLGGALDLFIVYLERHIEVDGDDHGPMALKMMAEVCGGEDDPRWDEAIEIAYEALEARVILWDEVAANLQARRNGH